MKYIVVLGFFLPDDLDACEFMAKTHGDSGYLQKKRSHARWASGVEASQLGMRITRVRIAGKVAQMF